MASRQKFSNNGTSTLLGAFSIGATSCSVQAGHGARFPSPGANEFFLFTLKDSAGNIEICKCTQRTGDTFNVVVRAQEGTTEQDWDAGDLVETRLTRDTMDRYPQKDANELITAGWVHQGTVNYASASGGGPAYTCTFTPPLTTLTAGQEYSINFPSAVTSTTPTLNPDTLGAKSIVREDGSAILSTDIPAGMTARLDYDGTKFRLMNPYIFWKHAEPSFLHNLGLSVSVAAGAITVALKQKDGSTNPTATEPADISFRDSTLTIGGYIVRRVTSSISLTIPNLATLGFTASQTADVFVYAIDTGAGVVLAVSGLGQMVDFDEGRLDSSALLDAASDSGVTLYSAAAQTNKPVRLIGRFRIQSGATPGDWTNSPTEISVSQIRQLTLGEGQTWQNMTGSRAFGTSYQNLTGRSIQIKSMGSIGAGASLDMLLEASPDNSSWVTCDRHTNNSNAVAPLGCVDAVIPPGWYYRITAAGVTLNYWSELR